LFTTFARFARGSTRWFSTHAQIAHEDLRLNILIFTRIFRVIMSARFERFRRVLRGTARRYWAYECMCYTELNAALGHVLRRKAYGCCVYLLAVAQG
jgi:hypothetical protein